MSKEPLLVIATGPSVARALGRVIEILTGRSWTSSWNELETSTHCQVIVGAGASPTPGDWCDEVRRSGKPVSLLLLPSVNWRTDNNWHPLYRENLKSAASHSILFEVLLWLGEWPRRIAPLDPLMPLLADPSHLHDLPSDVDFAKDRLSDPSPDEKVQARTVKLREFCVAFKKLSWQKEDGGANSLHCCSPKLRDLIEYLNSHVGTQRRIELVDRFAEAYWTWITNRSDQTRKSLLEAAEEASETVHELKTRRLTRSE
jgi:hypothetical protein